jgi:carbohydrate kinase (thermoresistant glucokinase family)
VQQRREGPSLAVVMGVSGAGKTTIGQRLAKRLGWEFVEGDELHPPENVAKMKSGHPLTDADRAPWLAGVAAAIDARRRRGGHAVITCSALKRGYRRQIIGARRDVRLVYLEGSQSLIAERLAGRRGHFMSVSLLDSQFATLEPPGADEDPITVNIGPPIEEIVLRIAAALSSSARSPQNPVPA